VYTAAVSRLWRLLVLGLLALGACTPAPLAVLAPGGRLAFVGGEGDLFTVQADGSDVRRLTRLGGPEDAEHRQAHFWPTWSPDGRRIAVTRADLVDGELAGAGLYAVPAGGGPALKLYAAEHTVPFFCAWAPDSRTIAILTTEEGSVALHVRAADGSGGHQLAAGNPLYLAWAPDGRALAVHLNGDVSSNPEAGVFIVPVEGGSGRTMPLAPTGFRAPAYTPDGHTLVTAGSGPDGRDVVVAFGDDGAPRPLAALDGAPAFVLSPTGDRLALSRHAPVQGLLDALDVVDLASGATARWDPGPVVAFFWSPDGTRLAWIRADLSERELVWYVAERPGAARRVAAFVPSNPSAATLSFFDQYAPTTAFWSPDSRRLAFAGWLGRVPDGPSRIWVADLATDAPPRAVADGLMASWSPALARPSS
jgi:TolB protein